MENKIICDCGTTLNPNSHYKHLKTKKHKDIIESREKKNGMYVKCNYCGRIIKKASAKYHKHRENPDIEFSFNDV